MKKCVRRIVHIVGTGRESHSAAVPGWLNSPFYFFAKAITTRARALRCKEITVCLAKTFSLYQSAIRS